MNNQIDERFDKRFNDTCWNDGEYDKVAVKAFLHAEVEAALTSQKQHYKERVEELIETIPNRFGDFPKDEVGYERASLLKQSLKSKALDIFGEGEEQT